MPDACETLINNYVAGELNLSDLEQGLTTVFIAAPEGHAEAQSHLQTLFSKEKIDSNGFTEVSHLISRINIQATLGAIQDPDFSHFVEDQTLHLTDITGDLGDLGDEDGADKTVIVSVDPMVPPPSGSTETSEFDDTPSLSPKIVEKPHRSNRHENLGPGVTLKERFVLLEKLGQGGMGVVFKAKDLLKVEAQDKDPYVAIKVLTDAFKKYSGSFIALQREASKAQRLAHPNIATVYDFDRDGNTVFMTMEYLKGKPINQLIKEISKRPLKINQALHIITELSEGLAYAHKKNLIHSDFKPGNCFLLHDGHVKLLDFGIARASTQTDEERENTMFDPAKLSAITPAYATPEMFAGMNPDPRDDIYGLACVAYQLLAAGKHPYNKVASPKIKELGIKPKPIKGLDRRQQRTLMRALDVTRNNRIETVEEFSDGMRSQKSNTKAIAIGAVCALFIAIGIGYKPFSEYREGLEIQEKIQKIKDGDKVLMIETIWSLDQMEKEQQKIISVGLRREIITFYQERIRAVFRPKDGLYDYPQALDLLAQAKKHFPDSVALSTTERQIQQQRDRLLSSLTALYNRYVDEKRLVKSPRKEDITTVLPLIQRVDPNHILLKNKALADLYLIETEALLIQQNYVAASTYITTGLKYFPNDSRLISLNQQINAQSQN